jgi:hypothetical protein
MPSLNLWQQAKLEFPSELECDLSVLSLETALPH